MQAALRPFETWSRTRVEERAGLLFRAAELLRQRKFEFMRLAGPRSRQELGRGRRRHRRDHRLLEFYAREALRSRPGRNSRPAARRARPAALHSARRRRGDSAVELPLRDHGRHDRGVDRLRQHRRPEALERLAHHRREVLRSCWKRPACPTAWSTSAPARARPSATRVVEHPQTRFIAFTGSKRRRPARSTSAPPSTQPGQIWIKRTILEMGGKDSIIVDADADLDAAVEGVAQPPSASRARSARPARAPSSTSASTTCSCDKLKARVEKITDRRSRRRTRTSAR